VVGEHPVGGLVDLSCRERLEDRFVLLERLLGRVG
jgi:hypothetical protein